MKRIASIDVTRGIVMVIMALDHVRDLLHVDSLTQSPTNLETTTPILFFTRWITHLCAPTFVFLAGTSAYLSFKNSQEASGNRSFLVKRGVYLILLEFLVVNFALFFDPGFHTLLFEVIAAIGFGFIILGFLGKAPIKAIGVIGLVILLGHNLVPLLPLADDSAGKTVLTFLFNQTAVPVFSNRVFVMAYPPIPWLGLMLLGFASGVFFERAVEKRKRLWIQLGFLALLLFFVLRLINSYGDPVPWSSQKTAVFTLLSFMNVTKYPPSLQFCLVTIGVMFFLLARTEGAKNKLSQMVAVYGRVPLFYFLVHFFVIHFLLLGLLFLQGFSWPQMDFAAGTFGRPKGVQSGVALWAVYLIWLGVVLVLYKPCQWFGNYKARHAQWWLKYI